jgi:hypothetical protein
MQQGDAQHAAAVQFGKIGLSQQVSQNSYPKSVFGDTLALGWVNPLAQPSLPVKLFEVVKQYLACGWWTMMAAVDCSGTSW